MRKSLFSSFAVSKKAQNQPTSTPTASRNSYQTSYYNQSTNPSHNHSNNSSTSFGGSQHHSNASVGGFSNKGFGRFDQEPREETNTGRPWSNQSRSAPQSGNASLSNYPHQRNQAGKYERKKLEKFLLFL